MFGTRNTFMCARQCCRKHLCTPAQAGGCLPGMPLAMLGSAKESGHHSGAPARGCQSDRWGQKIQGSIFSLSGRTGVSWGPARSSRSQSQNGQAGRTTVSHRSVQTPWWNIWNISQPLWTICRCSITVQMELPGHQLPPVPFVLLLSINETEPGSILSARFFRCLYTSMRSPLEAEQLQLPQPFLVRDAAVPSPPRLNSSRSLSPPQRSLRPAAGAPHLPCP